MHDVVVVGSRCAGAPLAMLLARAGHDVLLVDRATFPSDTMSTHFVQSPGIVRLQRWGLLDAVMATGCPPITGARIDAGGDVMEFELPPRPGIPGLASPRRHVLDEILVNAALDAGAGLASGVSVGSVLFEDGRAVGVSGHTSDGPFEARGRFVVGADGRHSVVARETGAPFRTFDPSHSAGYYSYFRGLDCRRAEMYLHDGAFCVMFPTNDGLTTVALAAPVEGFHEMRRDIDGWFRATLAALGLAERFEGAERVERYVGTADAPNYLRKAWGPGWALAGDACYYKDPGPADGISDAFRAADYLASALDEILTGRASEDDALARFEQRHDAIAQPLLEAAVRMASFDRSPTDRAQAFLEIRLNNEEEVEALLAPA